VCAVALAGCGPVSTVTVVQSDGFPFEGGSCGIVVRGTGLAADQVGVAVCLPTGLAP
jgi:hypothetical protein